MSSDPANDRSDLEDLRRGDEAAFSRLVARWKAPLIGFAQRYWKDPGEAHELTAQTFVKLYEHRHRLREGSNLAAWLFTTLTNLCRNQHRWRRRHPTIPLEGSQLTGSLLSAEADPVSALQERELAAALQAAVEELPHKLKAALLLHQYERLSHREIGVILRCSEKSVEVRIYRARRQLRLKLKGFIVDGDE